MAVQGFKYQKRSYDQVKKNAEKRGGNFLSFILPDFPTFSPKAGANWVRILPPTWDDPEDFGHELWVHFDVGPDKGAVACLDMLGIEGQKCPICQTRARADFEGQQELADSLKPGRRVICWVIDRNKQAEGPKVWAMGGMQAGEINACSVDEATKEVYPIDDPDSGYDITFTKTEGAEKRFVKYSAWRTAKQPSKVPDDIVKFVMAHPIPSVLNLLSRDEILAHISGGMIDSLGRVIEGDAPAVSTQAAAPEAQPEPPVEEAPPPDEPAPAAKPAARTPLRTVQRPEPKPEAAAAPEPAAPSGPKPMTAMEKLRNKLANK
jgi:hypothetical protein